MLVIRFLRVGKKNQPSFKIVVVDKRRSSKSGRFLEEVGFYNPLTKEKVLKADRIKYWLSKGVRPSPTVHNLLIKEKILEGKKIPKHKKPKKKPSFAKATEGKEKKPEEVKPKAKPEAKTEEKSAEKTLKKKVSEKQGEKVPEIKLFQKEKKETAKKEEKPEVK